MVEAHHQEHTGSDNEEGEPDPYFFVRGHLRRPYDWMSLQLSRTHGREPLEWSLWFSTRQDAPRLP